MAGYGLVADLRAEVEVPRDGILSRVLFNQDGISLTVFGFDAGQSLSEHTAARRAIIEVLEGEAEITLGGEVHEARAGTWIAMPAGLAHAILARTPMKMALTLLPVERPAPG